MQLLERDLHIRLCGKSKNYCILGWDARYGGTIGNARMLRNRMVKMGWPYHLDFASFIWMELTSGEIWYSDSRDHYWTALNWTEDE